MLGIILDGYIDEPSALGVPPYIAPYIRQVAGVCKELDIDCKYVSIDQWRAGSKLNGDFLVFIGGAVVPGKYLRTYPASVREVLQIAAEFKGLKILGGGLAKFGIVRDGFDYYAKRDVDALLYDVLTDSFESHRAHKLDEWNRWLLKGADIVKQHPDFPKSLMAEIETFRGCPRYLSGGCSFCIEPLYGKPVFRDIEDIVNEVRELINLGVQHFRVGGQSCIYSYMGFGMGKKELVQPNVGVLNSLFSQLYDLGPKVLHVDNANPAVIATYPDESRKITELLVKYTTPGNVVSFGMESADPGVIEKNNLNATPEQVLSAIKLVNELGSERGENGMPRLLPGLNFICGLLGETRDTYGLNFKFLKSVLDSNYMIRRINIRQVASIRRKFKLKYKHECWKFRNLVREKIDKPMLRKIVPPKTVVRDVYIEMHKGNYSFGRQIGSYPLVIVLPYKRELGEFVDVKVIGYGERSLTGVEYPIDVNTMSYRALMNIPGIGEKKAADIVRNRPYSNKGELVAKYPELREFIED